MAIITVLATLALVVIGEAQYDARRNATQARINQISKMLQQRLEDYQVRPVPLPSVTNYVDNTSQNFRLTARDLKRCILTDTINVEMPRSLLNIAYTMGIPGSPMNASFPSGQMVQWVGQAKINQCVIEDLGGNGNTIYPIRRRQPG